MDDLFPETTHPANVSRKRANDDISPRPWSIERTNKGGWKGICILDANGVNIARMVMQLEADNELANAQAIVAAVNAGLC